MRKALAAAVIVLVIGATAAWKVQHDLQEEQAGLLARAAFPFEEARRAALAAAPGRITEWEIEEENGRLIYAFDIEVPGQGTFDVEIDAMTGELLQSELENEDDDDDDDGDDGPR